MGGGLIYIFDAYNVFINYAVYEAVLKINSSNDN